MSNGISRDKIRVYGATKDDNRLPHLQCAQCLKRGSFWFTGMQDVDDTTLRPILPLFDYGKTMVNTNPAPACSEKCAIDYFFKSTCVRRLRGESKIKSLVIKAWPTIDAGRDRMEYEAKERDISIS